MNKFKNATKRITAVAASAVMVSSATFATGLGSYPSNFVTESSFNGQVVVGSTADAMDMTSATSIIDDLASEFSGDTEKVEITYKSSSSDGTTVSAVDDKETLNFGENLGDVDETLDDDATSVLEDGELDSEDFTQTLDLIGGKLDHRIFNEVDSEDEAKSGVFYSANEAFMTYELNFDDDLDISTDEKKDDFQGEELTIMGTQFTLVDIDNEEITLIGGANKIALGEGDESTITVDGKSFEISVQSVSETEVLITINGETKSIDEYEVEEMAGISVAVTDLVESSRDAVKGYAEIVLGGQKVELTSSTVKVNDEDLDDISEDYDVTVAFSGGNLGGTDADNEFEGMIITYRVDENVVLGAGDVLEDVLFGAFELSFNGLNDVDYSTVSISLADDGVSFTNGDGNGIELHDGNELPSEFQLRTDDTSSAAMYLGTDSTRIFHAGSNLAIDELVNNNAHQAVENSSATVVSFEINATTTDVENMMIFSREQDDEFYLYEFTSVDRGTGASADLEVDFTDLLDGTTTNGVDYDNVQNSLELNAAVANDQGDVNTTIDTANLGDSILYLANELEMDFTNVEFASFTSSSEANLTFSYNTDVDMDDAANESDSFTLSFSRDGSEPDQDPVTVALVSGHSFVNNDRSGDEEDEGSDIDVYVDHYGTMLRIDTDADGKFAEIMTPSEEVHAMVDLVFGGSGSIESTITVDAADVEAKKSELIADGNVIVGTETVSSEEVSFDVTSPVMDSDVSGTENMIVVGGPAVNSVAAALLGLNFPTLGSDSGVNEGEAVVRYFVSSESVLVYGWAAEDTKAAADELNKGGLTGNSVSLS